jgi:hypothetical protein
MTVKLLATGAKELLEQRFEALKLEYHRATYVSPQDKHRYNPSTLANLGKDYEVAMRQLHILLQVPEYWNSKGALVVTSSYVKDGLFKKKIKGHVIVCQNAFFEVVGLFNEKEARLLVQEKIRKMRSDVERLQRQAQNPKPTHERLNIPEEVRNQVWRRDQGKCWSAVQFIDWNLII